MKEHENREEDLFIEWLELSPEDRKGFIDTVCMDDPDMRGRLLELIKHFESSEDLFQVTPEEDFSEIAAEVQSIAPSDETAGDQIGRYLLREKIGEGAWGTVWLAQQTEDINRMVALKILKLGLDTKDFLRRFEAERQMLALMEHPSIATIHDAGSTDFGRPYLVMELVQGRPLVEYADEKKMTVEERVELYIRICKALDHAHQKGVIHRDIKPSNILVAEQDDVAVPKVIDFGVAKTNRVSLGEKTLYTSIHTFTGTPLYSSPEQLEYSGQVVDHRSDVYSLGALLYELLVGAPPFDHEELSKAGFEGMRKIVRETDPPIPSRRFSALETAAQQTISKGRRTLPPKLEMQLKGDLDWVILKCLEKDRKRRYLSAHALAEDLQAFLDCRPVSAAAPSVVYRARKFIRRNRLGSMAWAVVPAAVLCVAALFLFVKSRNATPIEFVSPYAMAVKEGNQSVAVLPFESFNKDDEYIAAGLQGELTNAFSRIQDLKTIARESTLRYRDSSKSLATIGEDLGVITVVTGDVQRMGDNVRINVQLIDVLDNRTLWGDSYTRVFNPDSFFDVLTEISTSIIDELGSHLSPDMNKNLSGVPTQNREALAAYFRGIELFNSSHLLRLPEAIEDFEKAIELDPEFVEAYALLSQALFTNGHFLLFPGPAGYKALGLSRGEAINISKEKKKRAFEAAEKGLEMDDSLLDLQWVYAMQSMHEGKMDFARTIWEQYIEERPNDSDGYMGMGYLNWNTSLLKFPPVARSLDNPDWVAAAETTLASWKKTVELDPTHPWWRKEYAVVLNWLGRSDEYMAQLRLNVYHNPEFPEVNQAIAEELVDRSQFDEAMVYLRKSLALGVHNYADNLMRIYESLGDIEAAVKWAERSQALLPGKVDYYENQILRLRGEDELAAGRFKGSRSENMISRGSHSVSSFLRSYDIRMGQTGTITRYRDWDPLFFESNVVELVKSGDLERRKKSPAGWCILAMELAAFLMLENEQEQADRLLDAASYLLETYPQPDLWITISSFKSAPGNSKYLFYQAINYSLRGDKEGALTSLREAIDLGFSDRLNLNDARFDSLREEPEFLGLINILDAEMAQQLANIHQMEVNGELAAIPKVPKKK